MLNKAKFAKRLQRIFDYYDINASAFAEKIDVNKASISHLLSGRNNPSLDFVMRVVSTFPEVDMYWLVNGKGVFPKTSEPPEKPVPKEKPTPIQNSLFDEELLLNPTEKVQTGIKENISDATEPVERVVIFFKNGKFKSYTPE
jgi:transcriptional regulator with XRE-family HTH domain